MIAYLRVVEGKDSHVRWHQVWDGPLFVMTLRNDLSKKGITVAVITEEEYQAEKWPGAPGRKTR